MLVWRLPASDQITECTKGKGTAMKQQFLHENWEMRQIGNDEFLPAAVPGSVYGDLLSNGKMENPFWKDNENDACELMEEDYEYVSHFDCEDGLLDSDRVVLRFDGIDTVGDVYLNEIHLGSPLSMHRVWEYDVKEILHEKDNELKVILHSPNKWIREAFKKCRTLGNDDTFEGFVHLRKAHYMFGWDWGAHLPDAGIFRPVSLLGINTARIDSVYIKQTHERTGETEPGTVRPITKSVTLTFFASRSVFFCSFAVCLWNFSNSLSIRLRTLSPLRFSDEFFTALNNAAIPLNGRHIIHTSPFMRYGNRGNSSNINSTSNTAPITHFHQSLSCASMLGVYPEIWSIGEDTAGIAVYTPSRLNVNSKISKSKNCVPCRNSPTPLCAVFSVIDFKYGQIFRPIIRHRIAEQKHLAVRFHGVKVVLQYAYVVRVYFQMPGNTLSQSNRITFAAA